MLLSLSKYRKSCSNSNKRNPGGNKPIKNTPLQRSINKHMEERCTIAANRFLIKEEANAFNRHESLRSCYNSFADNNKLSLSAFINNMANKFKKPHRMSDLCETCEQGKFLFKALERDTDKIDLKQLQVVNVDSNLDKLERYLNHLKLQGNENELMQDCESPLKLIAYLKEVQFHRCIVNMQKNSYNSMKSDVNLLKGAIVIDLDFKQKVVIGDSPRMMSGEYYERQQRSLLGFGVHYFDENTQTVRCKNFDLISEVDCKQNAAKAIHGFKFLRSQLPFKEIEKPNYFIWSDCGGHFRCAEFLSFLFDDLKKKEKINVNLNFFAEKHGKNSRDQHFSVISNYVRLESFKQKITCTQILVDVLNRCQNDSNIIRKNAKHAEIESFAYVLKSSTEKDFNTLRKVDNLKLYYNFSSYIINENIYLSTQTFSPIFIPFQTTIDVESKLIEKPNTITKPFSHTSNKDVVVETSSINTQNNEIREENVTSKKQKTNDLEEESEDEDTERFPNIAAIDPSTSEKQLTTLTVFPLDKLVLKRSRIEMMNNATTQTERSSVNSSIRYDQSSSFCTQGNYKRYFLNFEYSNKLSIVFKCNYT